MADGNQDFATVIGADAKFKGDLVFDSNAKVLGTFEGSITSKGKLHIADGSTCKATVTAKEVAVEGRIDGNVEADDRIDLLPTGTVTGDIVATRMSMAEGASINGHCQIGPNGRGKSSSSSSSSDAKGETVTETKPAASRPQPTAAKASR